MQLAFDQVSFTYDAQAIKRGKSSRSATADWGTSPDSLWALQNVSFSVNQGDFLGIAGHTGSGKSTLVQHMNGLLTPTRGHISFDGQDMSSKAVRNACRSAVGVVFQYPERQLFAPTVFDDVAFGPRNLNLDAHEVDRRVHRALEAIGLVYDEVGALSPFELSGGQQRRVAFAGVLAMSPQILVLDEPTAGLDPEAKSTILKLITHLHTKGLTIVMVSHHMEDLAALCTRVLVLNQGSIVLEGTPEQVFSQGEQLHSIGLDVPAAHRMAHRLRTRGIPLPEKLYTSAEDLAKECASLYHEQKGKAR